MKGLDHIRRAAALALLAIYATSCFNDGKITDLGIYVFISVGAVLIGIIYVFASDSKDQKTLQSRVDRCIYCHPDFKATKVIDPNKSKSSLFYLAMDDEHMKFMYVYLQDMYVINYKNIQYVDLKVDGRSIKTEVSTLRTASNYMAGRFMAGEMGGLIGAMATETTQKNTAKRIRVQITMKPNTFPTIDIYTLVWDQGIGTDTDTYRRSYALAREIYSILNFAKHSIKNP